MLTFRQKLEKSHASLTSHARKCVTRIHARYLPLIDRYGKLRGEAMLDGQKRADWLAYCEAHGIDPSHDGYDFF